MDRIARSLSYLVAISLASTIVGCSGGASDLPELGQVSGKVTLDGQPLANAYLTFTPDGTGTGNPSRGYTDASGNYELMYGAGNKGAVLGKHKVIIVLGEGEAPQLPEGADPDKLTPEQLAKLKAESAKSVKTIPARYNDQTELQVEVKAGSNTHNFDLKSK